MGKLSTADLGDVEVEWYRNLIVGSHILLWYTDDHVWHEALVAYIVGGEEVVIHTPDADTYVVNIACRRGADGPAKLRGMAPGNKVPRSLRGRVYRFRKDFTDDELRTIYRLGHQVAKDEGCDVTVPDHCLDSKFSRVSVEAFFDGQFVRRRLPLRGAAGEGPGGSTGGSPDSPKNARKVAAAGSDSVWVASEPLGGLVLGQEVSLNTESDVQCGDFVALALRSGAWVKCELIPLSKVASYADERRGLFKEKALAVVPDPPARQPATAPAGGDDGDEAHGDVRTLWVDFDEHGERFKRWRDVCRESFVPSFAEAPLEGPVTGLHLLKHTERHGGDPRLWMQLWMRTKKIEATDRVYHELKVLIDALYYAGTFDQLNVPGLMSMEVICRRIQAISDAYTNPAKPSWENAKVFAGLGSPEDIVSPTFRTYAVKKNKDELELLQARQKVRELRGGPAFSAEEASADAGDALPSKAPRGPKPKRAAKGGAGAGEA